MISCAVPEMMLPSVVDEPNFFLQPDAPNTNCLAPPSLQVVSSPIDTNQLHNMVQIPNPPMGSPQNPVPSPTNFGLGAEYYMAALQQAERERDLLRNQKILSQFNGDYKITDNYVRINGSCVTFWMDGNQTTEGKLTLKKFGNKMTVVLTADFHAEYIFYWTNGGDDFIEWTHYTDYDAVNPVRWTKVDFSQPQKVTPRKQQYSPIMTRNRHHSYGSMHSSVTSERLDMSDAYAHSSRESTPSNSIHSQQSFYFPSNSVHSQQSNHYYPHSIESRFPYDQKKSCSPKKRGPVNAQDHNAKQKMLCKTGFECIDNWADIVIDKVKALYLRNTTKQQRECQDVKTMLHNICDDIKPGLRGPFVFGIRAKKLGELENTIPFLKDMENISTFKRMSLIFNSKRKKVDGKSLKKRQKKTICIYVEVENATQVQEVLKRHKEKWSHLIAYCQIRDDEN